MVNPNPNPVPVDDPWESGIMSDAWLDEQLDSAVATGASCYSEADIKTATLRSFANRILLRFGGDKSAEALAVPYTITEERL